MHAQGAEIKKSRPPIFKRHGRPGHLYLPFLYTYFYKSDQYTYTYRLSNCHEPVTHPPACGSIPTNIRESSLKVPVGRAERHLLDGLVDDQAFGVLVHNAEAIAVDVQDGTDGFAF